MQRAESTPVRMVATILVTCAVASSALALTYSLTRDRIAAQVRLAEQRALSAALPEAEQFVGFDDAIVERAAEATGDTPVVGVFEGTDGGGDSVGWAVRVAPRGYGGPMQMVVGVDRNGKVAAVSIITQNETPGLGTKILTEPGFMEQFGGWDAEGIDSAAKAYDAISGATRSSNGVRAGVIAAARVYSEVLVGEGGGE